MHNLQVAMILAYIKNVPVGLDLPDLLPSVVKEGTLCIDGDGLIHDYTLSLANLWITEGKTLLLGDYLSAGLPIETFLVRFRKAADYVKKNKPFTAFLNPESIPSSNVPNYVSRRWLNRDDSASTGNVVAFDGYTTYHGNFLENTFLSVSDCYQTIRLHPTENDSKEDFINKMTVLRDEIDKFITHLKQREEDDKQE